MDQLVFLVIFLFSVNSRENLRSPSAPERRVPRQLVIFINLPGIINTKVGIFMEHARQRAFRLGATCSALQVFGDGSIKDMKSTSHMLYAGLPKYDASHVQDIRAVAANQKIAQEFIGFIEPVEDVYDHILIIGEMSQVTLNHRIQRRVSGISALPELVNELSSLTNRYAAGRVWQRVQICFSQSLKISPSSPLSFAEMLAPRESICHQSAPEGWSVIGRNGAAIDFLGTQHEFYDIIAFMHKAVSSTWCYDEIKERLEAAVLSDKVRCSKQFEQLDVHCIYPSKKLWELVFEGTNHSMAFFVPIHTGYSPSSSRRSSQDTTPTSITNRPASI